MMSWCTLAVWLVVGAQSSAPVAAEHSFSALRHEGRVVFGDVPVPGAIVTATREQHYVETVTDQEGVYRFVGLSEGLWTLRVRALGFVPGSRSVLVERGAPALTWRISMLPVSGLAHEPTGAASARAGSRDTSPPSERSVDPEPIEEVGTAEFGSADALVITGSIHNGLASPFAQPMAFGNNRPDTESVRTGSFSILGRIPDFPVTRSHPPASWPSAANSSICRTYRKTAGEESRRRSPVANRWMRP